MLRCIQETRSRARVLCLLVSTIAGFGKTESRPAEVRGTAPGGSPSRGPEGAAPSRQAEPNNQRPFKAGWPGVMSASGDAPSNFSFKLRLGQSVFRRAQSRLWTHARTFWSSLAFASVDMKSKPTNRPLTAQQRNLLDLIGRLPVTPPAPANLTNRQRNWLAVARRIGEKV